MKTIKNLLIILVAMPLLLSCDTGSFKASGSSEIPGTYAGISESSGSTIIIQEDMKVTFTMADGNSITGTAVIKKSTEDPEKIKRKIEEKLNNHGEPTGDMIEMKLSRGDKTKDAYFVVVKSGTSIILWGGGDAFFQKKM